MNILIKYFIHNFIGTTLMKFLGDLVFAGLGQAKNLRVEGFGTVETPAAPASPAVGQIWYDVHDGVYKGFAGSATIVFATGGNTSTIDSEITAIEGGAGLETDGTYLNQSGTHYLDSAETLKAADVLLDTQIKSLSDAIGDSGSGLQKELDDTQAGAGLGTGGAYSAPSGTTYLGSATSLANADVRLDTAIKAVADLIGGATTGLQGEVNAIETAAGIDTDGSFIAFSGTTYLETVETLAAADSALDDAAFAAAGAASDANDNADSRLSLTGGTMTGAIDMNSHKITGIGTPTLATDGATKGYVDSTLGGLSWKQAVDGVGVSGTSGAALPETCAAGDRFLITATADAGKIFVATATDTWDLGTDSTAGTKFLNTGDGKIYTATALNTWGAGATSAIGTRYLNSVDGKVYQATAENTFDAGTAAADGDALFDKATETGYVYSGAAWTVFTGTGQIVAGIGLAKDGNILNVNLGGGIKELPTDEVGVDNYSAGGLWLVDPSAGTESSLTNAQLSIKLNGATLELGASGLNVKAAGITATELNASVAGDGLAGGGGTALSVGAGTGLEVSSDAIGIAAGGVTEDELASSVAGDGLTGGNGTALSVVLGTGLAFGTGGDAGKIIVNTTTLDALYVNTSGDTMTGELILSDDPSNDLGAVPKQYADAVNTLLGQSTYSHTYTSTASQTVTHNIGSKYVNVTVFDADDKVIIPDSVTLVDANSLTITFLSAIAFSVVVTGLAA